ncbi:MAG: EAL domain-containing protein [Coriobacteriales bacterium]|jgi:lactose/cellobiose-specific phosphotransferase system IIC component|nr:EAL domain-containing protein [Coriobacteriales bacterium]
MVEFIGKLAAVFAKNKLVRAINNGLINLIPFVLVGAICIALLNLPIPIYQEALNDLLGGHWRTLSELITFATLDIIGVATLLSVSYTYASEKLSVKRGDIHPFLPMFTALACYVILFTGEVEAVLVSGESPLVLTSPGRAGVFAALVTALVSVGVFFGFVKLWRHLRPPRLSALDTNLQIRSAFRAVFPVAATLVVAALIRILISEFVPIDEIRAAFSGFVNDWLVTDSLGSVLLTIFLIQALWFFGAHGSGLIIPEFPLVSDLQGSPQALFATQDFYSNFVELGGSGATLGLLIALFLVGSAHHGRRLAKASLFPSLFNTNEIFLYGIPLILNPFFIVPFLLVPLLVGLLCFAAFSLGLVPPITQMVEWTCPVFLSGYLSTGSLAGSVLQLLCLAVSVLLYVPFVIALRRFNARQQAERVSRMQEAAEAAAASEEMTIIARDDAVGETAREIISRLHGYFETGTLPFHLVYQPKTDKDGRAVGAEALLRWEHREFGVISPVVLVELCDESGLATKLGRWITREAIAEYARWKQDGLRGLVLSINLHARHLCEDNQFPTFLGEVLAEQGIACGEIELEITEHLAMRANEANKQLLAAIRRLGVGLSIDDMGIGYSSLTYISDFDARGVKIDASLVSAIDTDVQQQEIVASIIQLAEQLALTVVVEGVETKEQVDALVGLGARHFQGYYFSKPLKPEDFIEYVRRSGNGA